MILAAEWAKAHWRLLTVLALCFAGGWFAHRPQPSMKETTSTKAAAAVTSQTDDRKTLESRDIQIEIGSPAFDMGRLAQHDPTQDATFDPVTRPAMPIIPVCANEFAGLPPGSKISIHEGPSTDDTHATSQESSSEEAHTQLTISASSPRWAVGGGLSDPLGARQVHLEAGMHLLGPFWLRVGSTPARGLSGTTIGGEVQW